MVYMDMKRKSGGERISRRLGRKSERERGARKQYLQNYTYIYKSSRTGTLCNNFIN